jgi:hypothetical protein
MGNSNRRGRGRRLAAIAGTLRNWPPTRQGDKQVRMRLRLPRWRGRHQGRHALTGAAADAATAAWVTGLAAGHGAMSLGDELAAKREAAAARSIEREYFESAELWPRNTDRLPPRWQVAFQTPQTAELGELADAPGLGAEDGLPSPDELGAVCGSAVLMAARILDAAGTVEAALTLAADALVVLRSIDAATRLGLDEDTRRLAGLLGEDQAGNRTGDA